MRIEDIDGPRIKQGAAKALLGTLRWLGLEWETPVLTQSDDLSKYCDVMRTLAETERIYQCQLTRREIATAASAPHDDGEVLAFPRHLRPSQRTAYTFSQTNTNYRMLVDETEISLADQCVGNVTFTSDAVLSDFVIWTRRGMPAYQLAVVVDDARQGVTEVVRADDLLPSAARQEIVYRALDLKPPRWWHLPLVVGEDGKRLAKRHGDTRIEFYRDAGVSAERIIGLAAFWSGAVNQRTSMTLDEFEQHFDISVMPRQPVVMTAEDHAWLMADC